MPTFGEQLKALRSAAGLTQASIAESIGVSNTYISALESGRKAAPPYALVAALAACLGVEEQMLWDPAVAEREERLRQRIAGVPTSRRIRRSPTPTPVRDPIDDPERPLGLLESLHESVDPARREKVADLLKQLADVLRDVSPN